MVLHLFVYSEPLRYRCPNPEAWSLYTYSEQCVYDTLGSLDPHSHRTRLLFGSQCIQRRLLREHADRGDFHSVSVLVTMYLKNEAILHGELPPTKQRVHVSGVRWFVAEHDPQVIIFGSNHDDVWFFHCVLLRTIVLGWVSSRLTHTTHVQMILYVSQCVNRVTAAQPSRAEKRT